MIKNLRKNNLLTIIVLISISGGCALVPGWKLNKSACKDAGLLVGPKYSKKESGSIDGNSDGYTHKGTEGYLYPIFNELDGVKITTKMGDFTIDSMELCPGYHTFKYGIAGERLEDGKRGEIEVVPYGVYMLIGPSIQGFWRMKVGGTNWKIERLQHTYDQTTGIAMHPTDSSLSFKAK